MGRHKTAVVRGETFGMLTVIKEVEPNVSKTTGKKQRRFQLRCACGEVTESQLCNLKSGSISSCGCNQRAWSIKHRLSHTPIYSCWKGMIRRCYDSTAPYYRDYGGRGISVCSRWRESVEDFLLDMGEKPNGLTLERVDVDGDYEPLNCKWETLSNQNYNTRKKANNTSGKSGVHTHECGKWRAKITKDKKQIHLGYFDNYEDAVVARQDAELHYYGFIKE